MNKEHTLIPELRFPEFKNDDDWKAKPLEKICTLVRGPFGGALKKEIFVNDGFAVYEQSHAIYSEFGSFRYRINEEKYKELKRFSVKPGDLIMSCSGTMGKFAMIPTNYEQGVINQALLKLTVKKGYDNSFVKISLETEENQNKLLSQSAGGAIKNVVAVSQIRKLELVIPNSLEQQKIANCISFLENAIDAHNQKLDLLNDHKNGLLQNLFPQQGETKPRHRFPEFENDEDWRLKKLGDKEVAFFVNEKVAINELNLESYISTENMLSGFRGISNASKLPSTGNFTKFKSGDILISNIRPYLNKVWKANKSGGASNDVLVFRSGSDVSCDFLEFILKNDIFINYVMKSAKGVKMPRGDKEAMLNYIVFIPSRREQEKIALCLSTLDELISAQIDKIDQLKLHKRGLIQSLFPKMND